jgi:hypothetical protein
MGVDDRGVHTGENDAVCESDPVIARPPQERMKMNSPLENHEVRLRGLGGRAASGVPGTCASAAG